MRTGLRLRLDRYSYQCVAIAGQMRGESIAPRLANHNAVLLKGNCAYIETRKHVPMESKTK